MRLTTIPSAIAALSLVAAPVAAQASGRALPARAGSHMTDAEYLRGGFIVPLLALAAVIAGILVLINDKKDTLPHSP
ncbi:MAG: hypothetical protein ABIP41_00030 [Croceibacterium sp.]